MRLSDIILGGKRIVAVVVVMAISLTALGMSMPDSGVDHITALQRKRSVSAIKYDLSLHIDSLQSEHSRGKVKIEFDYSPSDAPLLIDFAGEAVEFLRVNDKIIDNPVWKSGHIEINPGILSKGLNKIEVGFIAADRALNRNPDYMYTLFVPFRAHSVFPCFDQPDMKANYNLTLSVPEKWVAVSNSPVKIDVKDENRDYHIISFYPTEPLSTYLFAFAAGDFKYQSHTSGERTIGAYYRETDPDRLSQLESVFSLVEKSLDILEDFTAIPYPFAKYDIVILPGFQFGGMEHTGATFYNDNALFLTRNATAADILRQATVIAHETAHMWFGDYVTMEWFDEVWTKEVFANYFAARLARQLLPEYDHDLEWLRVYMSAAQDQDRSAGTTPILQSLDNMRNAGLIYNNIIYNKAPVMLAKLVETGSDDAFREGVRLYLASHPYGNATWNDFVEAMKSSGVLNAGDFSRAWVEEAGMPVISFSISDARLIVSQRDPFGRGIVWPQSFDILIGNKDSYSEIEVTFDGSADTLIIPVDVDIDRPALIIPAADGRAYGLLSVSNDMLGEIMKDFLEKDGLSSHLSPTGRLATLLMLNENYHAGNILPSCWMDFLIENIAASSDAQVLASLTRYIGPTLLDMEPAEAAGYETKLFNLAETHPSGQGRLLLMRALVPYARSAASTEALYAIWDEGSTEVVSVDDLCDFALHLAVSLPDKASDILNRQRLRIDNPDRLRRWDYVSKGASNDEAYLDEVFQSLSDRNNRMVEPWTLSLLALLNHPARSHRSVKYIIPALSLLPEIQQTGDIFFPANWVTSLLRNYRSPEAAKAVASFLERNKDMNPLLTNKILQASACLKLSHDVEE